MGREQWGLGEGEGRGEGRPSSAGSPKSVQGRARKRSWTDPWKKREPSELGAGPRHSGQLVGEKSRDHQQ